MSRFSRQLTYWQPPQAVPEPDPEPRPDALWGYTLADLDSLTRSALSRGWGLRIGQPTRYELVWSAIAEALCAAQERPEPGELVRAGWAGLNEYLADERHHWGVTRDGIMRPSFFLYWDEVVRNSRSPEGPVVERLALAQIWGRLRADEAEALIALAAYGEYQPAADALGLKYYTFCARVRRGRERFLRLWHEGETPSRMWGRDRRGEHRQRSGNDSVMGVLRRRSRLRATAT